MLFTSLAPNTEFDDALLAFSLLLRPWTWREYRSARNLEAFLERTIGPQYAISFESGRTALFTVLSAHGLAMGDEVVLQAYTCVVVPNAIRWAGGTPVFVDIDETLTMLPQDLEKKITPKTRAIIIQHTFGMPARLNELLAIAKAHRLFVIEDCAHALGTTYNGRPLGSFGNAAIFSFGRDKVISGVFGGAAVVNDEFLAERLRTMQQALPLARYGWIIKQLLHPILMWLGKTFYAHGGRVLIAAAKRFNWTSKALEPEERSGGKPDFTSRQLPGALVRLTLHQTKKLDRFNKHRSSLMRIYASKLSTHVRTQQSTVSEELPLIRFALWHTGARQFAELLAKEHVFLGDWYDTAIAPRDVEQIKIGYRAHSCPVAETISNETINLPTDIHVTETEAEKISERFIHELNLPH